jgi:hypothetical protein
MLHFLIRAGLDTLWATAWSCAVLAPFLAYPRTRRVIVLTARFIQRHAPWWAVPLMTACQFIVGPVDDVIALAVLAYPVMRSRRNRRAYARLARAAWRGGKLT